MGKEGRISFPKLTIKVLGRGGGGGYFQIILWQCAAEGLKQLKECQLSSIQYNLMLQRC